MDLSHWTLDDLHAELLGRSRSTPIALEALGLDDAPASALADVDPRTLFDEIRLRQKQVYGDDDRIEVHAADHEEQRKNARSVAAIFDVDDVVPTSGGLVSLPPTTFRAAYAAKQTPLCSHEPFADQPAGAKGTAFLVGPDLVATAAHCVEPDALHRKRFVFGYVVDPLDGARLRLPVDDIYAGIRIEERRFERYGADWAVVRLDRVVEGRAALRLRASGRARKDAPVYVIGHPIGLPMKVAGGATIRENDHDDYFVANLDTYGGSSGSPVFDAESHEVEGILVRGEQDFAPLGNCYASLVCPVQGCRGEDCARILPVADAVRSHSSHPAAMDAFGLLDPTPDARVDFTLPVTSGPVRLASSDGVEVYATRRSDGSSEYIAPGGEFEAADFTSWGYSVYRDRTQPLDPWDLTEVVFQYQESGGQPQAYLFGVILGRVLLDCDADRDGTVGLDEDGKANWTWGMDGRGAIMLVDNDRDDASTHTLDEREPLVVRRLGPTVLPAGVQLRLRTSPDAATKFSISTVGADGRATKLLGRTKYESINDTVWASGPLPIEETTYRVVANEYPGPFFEGLLLIALELVDVRDGREHIFATDRVMMRVAPWVMTPNTLPVEHVYTCKTAGDYPNDEFLAGLKAALGGDDAPLTIIKPFEHRGDRWIQDEIEFGYSRSHRGTLPVVFDSPRDGYLDDYPEIALLGPDFGHFQIGGGVPNSLDSFGNLEVSPPVVVQGRTYPLGRIVTGGRQEGDFRRSSRQMMAEVRQFLNAQKVQFPFEIDTDWLMVGHVDEVLSFVPAPGPKGFKVLLADTVSVRRVLEGLAVNGHGGVKLFSGKTRHGGTQAETTVQQLLDDSEFWQGNATFQSYLDVNADVLQRELGLGVDDFVKVPVCFTVKKSQGVLDRADAFFPNMVNHLVVDRTSDDGQSVDRLSVVPRPYGPVVDGKCALEAAFEAALSGAELERRVRFIDDWLPYFTMQGDVHCGTNARRTPPEFTRWWHTRPEGGFDIKSVE
ncbi:MAG: protein-arginine deiminase family protein [Planctomycetota bacterium]